MTEIAELLRSNLTERGAQKRLATALGIEQSNISNWVRGKSEPHPDKWEAIETHLNIERHTIAMLKGNVPGKDSLPGDTVTARLNDLEKRLSRIEKVFGEQGAEMADLITALREQILD